MGQPAIVAAPSANQVPIPWMTNKPECVKESPTWYYGFGEQLGCALPYDCATASTSCQPPLNASIDTSSQDELVDLDDAEGRRRGKELLALLQPESTRCHAFEVSASESESMLPTAEAHKPSSTTLGAHENNQLHMTTPSSKEPLETDYSLVQVHAQEMKVPSVCGIDYGAHHVAISTAAHSVFGANVALVECSLSGNFIVRFCNYNVMMTYLSEQEVLEMIAVALRPVVSREVRSLEIITNVDLPRLVMHCLRGDPEETGKFCWDYGWNGVCPRGPRCRWPHRRLSYAIGIRVSY